MSWAEAMLGNRMRLFDPTAADEPSSAGEAEVFAAGPSGAASALRSDDRGGEAEAPGQPDELTPSQVGILIIRGGHEGLW